MAIDDNASYELTGYQVKDLAQKIRAKADSSSLAPVATSGLYSDLTGAPTIPTVYNGTLTIQQNGTTLGTFSANQDTNETINITGGGASYTAGNGIDIANNTISIDTDVVAEVSDIPTKTSDLVNDGSDGSSTYVEADGTVAKADQLSTARTIALEEGATGTATAFNGSADISIPVTDVKDAYVTWGGKNLSANVTPDDMGCIDEFGHNKLAYLPAECINAAYTQDGGTTWTDYGANESQKIAFVTTKSVSFAAGGPNSVITSENIANNKVRVRIACGSTSGTSYLYTSVRKILINFSTNGSRSCKVKMSRRTIADYKAGTETWTDIGTYDVSGWSGWNSIPLDLVFGGNMSTQTAHAGELEFVFWAEEIGSNTSKCSVYDIRLIGATNWTMPSELARSGHLYTYDTSQNATFPGDLAVTGNISVGGQIEKGNYTYTLPNKNGTVALEGDVVTLDTDQNITGEKTFVGNKRVKFKGTASNSKLGFTTFDQNNGETGFLEVEGVSTASKKVRLGCYDVASGSARDNYLGFQYHNTKPVGGGTVSYNLVCPPQYKGVSGTNAFAYIPVDFTDGNTTVRADNTGILDLSTLLPSYSGFTGATSSTAGTEGLVPAPAAGNNTSFLRGDGTWTTSVDGSLDYSTSEVDTGHTWVDGSKIYKKTINFGALPNATSKTVAHSISNLGKIIKMEGYAYRSSDNTYFPLPFVSESNVESNIRLMADNTNITIATGVDRSATIESYVTLYYTKSS